MYPFYRVLVRNGVTLSTILFQSVGIVGENEDFAVFGSCGRKVLEVPVLRLGWRQGKSQDPPEAIGYTAATIAEPVVWLKIGIDPSKRSACWAVPRARVGMAATSRRRPDGRVK